MQIGDTITIPAFTEDIHQTPCEKRVRVFLLNAPYVHVQDEAGSKTIIVFHPPASTDTITQTEYLPN